MCYTLKLSYFIQYCDILLIIILQKIYTHHWPVPSVKLQHNSSGRALIFSHVYLAVKYSSRHQDYCWKDPSPLLQSEGEMGMLVSNTTP